MTDLQIKLPPSIQRKVRELAKRDEISVNQFVTTAVAEKMAALQTVDYLKRRAKRATRKKFERALKQIPNVAPDPNDRLE